MTTVREVFHITANCYFPNGQFALEVSNLLKIAESDNLHHRSINDYMLNLGRKEDDRISRTVVQKIAFVRKESS